MFMLPSESGRFIADHMEHVSIHDNAIDNLAHFLCKQIDSNEYDIGKWKSENRLHPQEAIPKAAEWIFIIDSLNFSFWPDSGSEFTIEGEVGYWALCAAINRALNDGIPITDPNYCSQMTIEQAKHVFRTDQPNREIPMLHERVQILNENGNILVQKFNSTFVKCIQTANSSALALLRIVYENFPSLRDECQYKERNVTFLKRAQILIADLWACFEGQSLGRFDDIDQLTMFADYRIPQALHHFGVLTYSTELMEQLQTNALLMNGTQFEVEIRGASIHAVELLRSRLKQLFDDKKIECNRNKLPNSIQIDFYLWGYRRQNANEIDRKSPYHKVRSLFY